MSINSRRNVLKIDSVSIKGMVFNFTLFYAIVILMFFNITADGMVPSGNIIGIISVPLKTEISIPSVWLYAIFILTKFLENKLCLVFLLHFWMREMVMSSAFPFHSLYRYDNKSYNHCFNIA